MKKIPKIKYRILTERSLCRKTQIQPPDESPAEKFGNRSPHIPHLIIEKQFLYILTDIRKRSKSGCILLVRLLRHNRKSLYHNGVWSQRPLFIEVFQIVGPYIVVRVDKEIYSPLASSSPLLRAALTPAFF